MRRLLFRRLNKSLYPSICIVLLISASQIQCGRSDGTTFNNSDAISDSLSYFFPEERESIKLVFTTKNSMSEYDKDSDLKFSTFFLLKVYVINDTVEYYNERNTLLEMSHIQYKSDNNDYFIIGSEYELLKKYSLESLRINYRDIDIDKLVPYFGDIFDSSLEWYSEETICKLNGEYTIAIIDSRTENVLKLKKNPNSWEILPDKIKHGYLTGASFSDKNQTIIYWVCTW